MDEDNQHVVYAITISSQKREENFLQKFIEFLKYGHSIKYWHNYIMDAYVNHTNNFIYVTGIPDRKGSKPHELPEV
ncbi:MAG TPA: hypothetical protein PLE64_04850 [Spirochaetota bacterium]|nr:hypothetical protein [Spirochaetota bacterium]